MDLEIVHRFNQRVTPEDTVYCLGDLCFWKPSVGVPLLKTLNGHRVLVKGNHDKYSTAQYRAAGFETIVEEMVIKIQGERVKLSHYPHWPRADELNGEPQKELRYPDRRPARDCRWLLHGHVHKSWKQRERMINVGVDVWDFAPVSESVIASLIKSHSP